MLQVCVCVCASAHHAGYFNMTCRHTQHDTPVYCAWKISDHYKGTTAESCVGPYRTLPAALLAIRRQGMSPHRRPGSTPTAQNKIPNAWKLKQLLKPPSLPTSASAQMHLSSKIGIKDLSGTLGRSALLQNYRCNRGSSRRGTCDPITIW